LHDAEDDDGQSNIKTVS